MRMICILICIDACVRGRYDALSRWTAGKPALNARGVRRTTKTMRAAHISLSIRLNELGPELVSEPDAASGNTWPSSCWQAAHCGRAKRSSWRAQRTPVEEREGRQSL